jgi:hypothetical protein
MRNGRLARVAGAAGVAGAAVTVGAGLLHPKGSSDVGSVGEWMTRVGGSDWWTPIHLALLAGALLYVVAAAGLATAFPEEDAAAWAHLGFVANVVAGGVAVVTFLFDGAVVKNVAELWERQPTDAAVVGAARLATETGFVLVAGLQVTTGVVALLFAAAGFRSRAHPRALAWAALVAGVAGVVPGAASYLRGAETWSTSMSYVSTGLFSAWVLAMSLRLRRAAG